MARAVDFDDGHDESMTHPSSVVVSAALAMAERSGGVDGKRLITAIVLGNEILVRLGLGIARRPGGLKLDTWFPSSVFGAFGGAAACCSILGFDAAQVRSAFGIVLFEASGTLEAFSSTGQSGMMRGMVTGLTAKSCTLATTMVEAGIVGVPDSIDGEFGLYRVYYGGNYNREAVLGELGEYYFSSEIGMKPWPTCRYTHSYIDATLQLVKEHDIRVHDIEQMRIAVAGYAESRCVPIERQRNPHNFNHAGHALPYLVAAAATRRRVDMDDLIHGLNDSDVLALADRVIPFHDPRFSIENRVGPSRVEADLKGGGTRVKELQTVYGGLGNPISWDHLVSKFRSCVAYSAKPLKTEAVELLVDRIARLEEVQDVGEIVRALA
jgi:2-methylcitrate dehydratase PrpD